MRVDIQLREEPVLEMLAELLVLAQRQFRERFFGGIADTTFNNRMRKLKQAGYIDYPTREQKIRYALPEENIYWLSVKGIEWIAARRGIDDLDFDKATSDKAKKLLAQRLLSRGIFWLWKPWKFLAHRLAAGDVRLAAFDACEMAGLHWDTWLNEWQFHTGTPDQVTIQLEERAEAGQVSVREETVPYYPDGVFWVWREARQRPGKQQVFSFIVECDMGSKENWRVLRQNILPALSYLKSEGYKKRTGWQYGRVLLITTGLGRVDNLKKLTEKQTNSRSVFFTTFADLQRGNFFIDSIWRQSNRDSEVALIETQRKTQQVGPPTPLPPASPFASV